jgi:hypothetical protein
MELFPVILVYQLLSFFGRIQTQQDKKEARHVVQDETSAEPYDRSTANLPASVSTVGYIEVAKCRFDLGSYELLT